MRIIEIVFKGGVGNQLFQYATAKAIMQKGDILLFNLDSYHNDYLKRSFRLFNYKISGIDKDNLFPNRIMKKNSLLFKLLKKTGCLIYLFEKPDFGLYELKKNIKLYSILEGYWQAEMYFDSIKEELKNTIRPKSIPEYPVFLEELNTVGIHVRRSDYQTNQRYGVLSVDYYYKAIKHIKDRVNNPLFIIFSDDIQWCKKNIFDHNIIYFENENWNTDYLQLFLMSKCSHNIIANSSFSWWGAWLNSNNEKIVIRPERPFFDDKLFSKNYYPNEWLPF